MKYEIGFTMQGVIKIEEEDALEAIERFTLLPKSELVKYVKITNMDYIYDASGKEAEF